MELRADIIQYMNKVASEKASDERGPLHRTYTLSDKTKKENEALYPVLGAGAGALVGGLAHAQTNMIPEFARKIVKIPKVSKVAIPIGAAAGAGIGYLASKYNPEVSSYRSE